MFKINIFIFLIISQVNHKYLKNPSKISLDKQYPSFPVEKSLKSCFIAPYYAA